MSTVVASRRLSERGVKGKRQRAVVDQAAAVEILQGRSEERRVGKEWRYWRDWSSDVCSSDLDVDGGRLAQAVRTWRERKAPTGGRRPGGGGGDPAGQIGRASCRERVEILA